MKVLVITAVLATITFCLIIGLQAVNTVMFSAYVGAASHYGIELLKSFK